MKHPMPDSLKQYINNSYKNLIVLTLLVTEAIFQCKEIYKAICDVSLGYGKYITSLNSHWWLCQGLTATSPALGSCPHTEWLGLRAALRPVVFYIFDLVDKVQRDVRVQVDEGNLCVVDLAAPEWNTLHTNKKNLHIWKVWYWLRLKSYKLLIPVHSEVSSVARLMSKVIWTCSLVLWPEQCPGTTANKWRVAAVILHAVLLLATLN